MTLFRWFLITTILSIVLAILSEGYIKIEHHAQHYLIMGARSSFDIELGHARFHIAATDERWGGYVRWNYNNYWFRK